LRRAFRAVLCGAAGARDRKRQNHPLNSPAAGASIPLNHFV
jgi:hypothetical protein